MKTLRDIALVTIFVVLAGLIVSYMPKEGLETSELEMIQELSYSDSSDDSVEWTEDTYKNKGFIIYLNELKNTHLELKQSRESTMEIVNNLKELKVSFEENNIQIADEDQMIIMESYQKVRFYRYMLEDTIGQGYQQLMELRENKDLYSKEASKDILIDVYLVLQSRVMLFNDMQDELMNIQNILAQY